MSQFQALQAEFAAHLRHPELHKSPEGIEERRLQIYRDLFYNNIETFASNTFPVLRSLLGDTRWHAIVRDFYHRHISHSPYFLEISQEFLRYFQEEFTPQEGDPPFLVELAHYEWVELALDVSTEHFPDSDLPAADLLDGYPVVSPLAWRLSYQYPVHRISAEFQPNEPPPAATCLVVYRNRNDKVQFVESNPVTFRLLQLFESGSMTGREALLMLASEMSHPQPEQLMAFGQQLVEDLLVKQILVGVAAQPQ